MQASNTLKVSIYKTIQNSLENSSIVVDDTTPLLGDGSALDSMKLVEVCLALEDLASENDFEFDWTSDSAMSRSRSMFLTAGSLAEEFITQKKTAV